MASYRPRLVAEAPYSLPHGGACELTIDALRAAFTRATVRELIGSVSDGYQIDVAMQRDSHASALDEIAQRLLHFGFAFVDASISEWVSQAVRGAVVGMLTAGGGTAVKTHNANATAAAASIGLVAGGIAGSFVHQEVARYFAQRDPWSGIWHITAVQLPDAPQFRFGYA